MIDNLNISGKFTVIKNGKNKVIKNRIMDTVLNKLSEAFKGTNPDLEIKYFAVGTDNTAVTDNDLKLGNEIFRTPVTTKGTTGTGETEYTFKILDFEAVDEWQEIGIFGGNATDTSDTGTLISRVLFNEDKTLNEEIGIIYTLTVGRSV